MFAESVNGKCKAELRDTRKSLMEDYQLSPELAHHCAEAIKDNCKGGMERGGKTLHCLMGLAHDDLYEYEECARQVGRLLEKVRPADDITLDPAMTKACRPMIKKCRDVKNVESEE